MSGRPPAEPLSEAEAAQLFEAAFKDATGVLIAVSGGADSMALMGLLVHWRSSPPLAAATVDHGLRRASADEARIVATAAGQLELSHRTLAWTGRKPHAGVQEAAREARYALLAAEARSLGFTHIATAHHADDQAETVLMRIASGSGVAGLAAMRPISAKHGILHARPLLPVSKDRLAATLAALGLPSIDDPSNADPRYGRTRMRAALGILAAEGLTAARLTRLAIRAARADDALQAATQAALRASSPTGTDGGVQADWDPLSAQPEEIRIRALSELLRLPGPAPCRIELSKLERLSSALDRATNQGVGMRRTIGGMIVTLHRKGRLTIALAPPRRGANSGTALEADEA